MEKRSAPGWLFGILALPYAVLVTGFVGTVLAYLLRREGVGVDRIGSIVALVNLPQALYFLWSPLTDFWMRRKNWMVLSSAVAAGLLFAAFGVRSFGDPLAVGLLFGAVGVGMMTSACAGGMMGESVSEANKARVGSFFQAGALGGGALGGGGLLVLAEHWGRMEVGALAAVAVVAPSLAGYLVPVVRAGDRDGGTAGERMEAEAGVGVRREVGTPLEARDPGLGAERSKEEVSGVGEGRSRLSEEVSGPGEGALRLPERVPDSPEVGFGDRWREMRGEFKRTFLRWEAVAPLLILAAPFGSGAALSLLPAVAPDYGVTAGQVAWINGLGGGVLTALGAMLMTLLPKGTDARVGYPVAGLLNAACLGVMLLGPPRPATYLVGAGLYLLTVGAAYALFTALVLQVMGAAGKSGGTRYSMLVSVGNLPVTYMAWVDGRGYRWFGPKGMAGADMVVSGAGAVCFLLWFWWRQRERVERGLARG